MQDWRDNKMSELNSNRGFTLVEVLVASAILGTIAFVTSSLVVNVARVQKEIDDHSIAIEFANQFTQHFKVGTGCEGLVNSALLTSSQPIEVKTFRGFGANNTDKTVKAGFEVSPGQVAVSGLTIRRKPGIPPAVTEVSGQNYSLVVAEINLDLSSIVGGQNRPFKSHTIEFPALVNSLNQLAFCRGEASLNESCATLGGQVDPDTGECKLAQQCRHQGTYSQIVSCTRNGNPWGTGCLPGMTNDKTGTQSCPPGSSAYYTGQRVVDNQVDCGKKCSYTTQNTEHFFTCMECP